MAIVIGNHHCILAKLIYNSIRQPIMNPYPHIVGFSVIHTEYFCPLVGQVFLVVFIPAIPFFQ